MKCLKTGIETDLLRKDKNVFSIIDEIVKIDKCRLCGYKFDIARVEGINKNEKITVSCRESSDIDEIYKKFLDSGKWREENDILLYNNNKKIAIKVREEKESNIIYISQTYPYDEFSFIICNNDYEFMTTEEIKQNKYKIEILREVLHFLLEIRTSVNMKSVQI